MRLNVQNYINVMTQLQLHFNLEIKLLVLLEKFALLILLYQAFVLLEHIQTLQ